MTSDQGMNLYFNVFAQNTNIFLSKFSNSISYFLLLHFLWTLDFGLWPFFVTRWPHRNHLVATWATLGTLSRHLLTVNARVTLVFFNTMDLLLHMQCFTFTAKVIILHWSASASSMGSWRWSNVFLIWQQVHLPRSELRWIWCNVIVSLLHGQGQ